MNQIVIKGRLSSAPEVRVTPNGVKVCSFTVAVNRRFDRDTTDFINCEAWRKTAELIENHFVKGQEILLCGELHLDKYEKNGEKRTAVKVVADNVEFCGSKSEVKQTPTAGATALPDVNLDGFEVIEADTDLPF